MGMKDAREVAGKADANSSQQQDATGERSVRDELVGVSTPAVLRYSEKGEV